MNDPLRMAPRMAILRGVSRSFYLSIRLLPAALREPVGVAYLLARATDTVADTAELPASERLATLHSLAAAIDGDAVAARNIATTLAAFAQRQSDPTEQALIHALSGCLDWLNQLADADQADIRQVVRTIASGQVLDVQRFGDASTVHALASADELRAYTWRVAGCVGEFWTQLCFRHLDGFADLPRGTMMALGRRYGMALQLINILRDAPADLAQGRCYFPADELAASGLSLQQVAADPALLAPVMKAWREEALALLDSGIEYAGAVRNRRVRAASALPALIGAPTLAQLQSGAAGRAKVPRSQVRLILAVTAVTFAARGPMRQLYHSLRP